MTSRQPQRSSDQLSMTMIINYNTLWSYDL